MYGGGGGGGRDVLRPPHCTTPATVKVNKNKK